MVSGAFNFEVAIQSFGMFQVVSENLMIQQRSLGAIRLSTWDQFRCIIIDRNFDLANHFLSLFKPGPFGTMLFLVFGHVSLSVSPVIAAFMVTLYTMRELGMLITF